MITLFTATPTMHPTTQFHITLTITAVQYTQVAAHPMFQLAIQQYHMHTTPLAITTQSPHTAFHTTLTLKRSHQVATTCHPTIQIPLESSATMLHRTTLQCMARTLHTILEPITTITVAIPTQITTYHTSTIQTEWRVQATAPTTCPCTPKATQVTQQAPIPATTSYTTSHLRTPMIHTSLAHPVTTTVRLIMLIPMSPFRITLHLTTMPARCPAPMT